MRRRRLRGMHMGVILDMVRERFADAAIEGGDGSGEATIIIGRDRLMDMCRFLRDEQGFTMLIDLCGVDYPARAERFDVVYHLYALASGKRLRLKVRLHENDAVVPTASGIWKAADWFEREAYDLFGIRFEGHPNLKRLLTFEGFEGHPLRKDYPKDKRQGIPKPSQMIERVDA